MRPEKILVKHGAFSVLPPRRQEGFTSASFRERAQNWLFGDPTLLKRWRDSIDTRLGESCRDEHAPESTSSESESLRAGSQLGPYRLLQRIGAGGMASVYLARHSLTGSEVALKVASAPSDGLRLEREATVLSKLDHPNIVKMLSFGREGDRTYLAMEYVAGVTMLESLAASEQSLEETLRLYQCLCEALGHVHDRGLVHRDLKPSNVMVDHHGNLKLLDFGLGWAEEHNPLTLHNQVVGTPTYMAPERLLRGKDQEGPAGDQYSLGVMLFESLTRRAPFVAGDSLAVLGQHLYSEPPDLRELRPDLGLDLALTVRRMLEKSPSRRFSDIRECGRAIAQVRAHTNNEETLCFPLVKTSTVIKRPPCSTKPNKVPAKIESRKSVATFTLPSNKVRAKWTRAQIRSRIRAPRHHLNVTVTLRRAAVADQKGLPEERRPIGIGSRSVAATGSRSMGPTHREKKSREARLELD